MRGREKNQYGQQSLEISSYVEINQISIEKNAITFFSIWVFYGFNDVFCVLWLLFHHLKVNAKPELCFTLFSHIFVCIGIHKPIAFSFFLGEKRESSLFMLIWFPFLYTAQCQQKWFTFYDANRNGLLKLQVQLCIWADSIDQFNRILIKLATAFFSCGGLLSKLLYRGKHMTACYKRGKNV